MWKDVVGYEGLYQVSDQGEVRRVLKNSTKLLKPYERTNYLTVCLSNKCERKTHNVHRLVAEAFLEKPKDATEVNHKDGDKHNNKIENLEWVSQKENLIHAMEKLKHYPYGKPPRKVKCINPETNEIIAEFHSLSDAAKAIGKSSARSGITLVCQGYQPKAYGFKWEYAD